MKRSGIYTVTDSPALTQDHKPHMPDEFFFQSSIRATHARGHGLTITLEDVGEVKPFGLHVELELSAQHMDVAVDLLPYARDQLDIGSRGYYPYDARER